MKITLESSVASLGPYADPSNLRAMGWTLRQIEVAVRRGTVKWLRNGNLEVISPSALGQSGITGVAHARKQKTTRKSSAERQRRRELAGIQTDPTGVYGPPHQRGPSDEITAHNLTPEDLVFAGTLGLSKKLCEKALSVLRGTSDDLDDWDAVEAVAEALEDHRLAVNP
jgi:hypothetical protein